MAVTNKHESWELAQMQSLPLDSKVIMTQQRIQAWYEHFEGNVYVSFSGGKDSTVLLHLVRELYPEVEAVFVDTGLEYPEIRQFVKTFDNVTWLKPEMTFKQVCQKYGFPFISKENARIIREAKIGIKRNDGSYKYRIMKLNGELKDNEGNKSKYNVEKYKAMLDAPFDVSEQCCGVMKKKPFKRYEKQSGKKPYIATMATESRIRKQGWMRYGCNSFEAKRESSNPMSFWTEQDVLHYIKKHNLQIASVYGDIVIDEHGGDVIEGQITAQDILGVYEGEKLTTTGCKRTGCMFCGFGCQVKGDTRFLDMKRTHPKQYNYIFKPESEGGLGYAEKIDYINEHCNTNIRY